MFSIRRVHRISRAPSLRSFHRSSILAARLLDGKICSRQVLDEIQAKIQQIQTASPNFQPTLVAIQVGNLADSTSYIRSKKRNAELVGINAKHVHLPQETTQEELLKIIDDLNGDHKVHGIFVQLPMDSKQPISQDLITDRILPEKDVDGFHTKNVGSLHKKTTNSHTIPCTAIGCLKLLKINNIPIAGKHCVVLGRSEVVGAPVAALMLQENATVTVCHSKTTDVASIVRTADILIVAIGQAGYVKKDWVKPGAVVIDCGINLVPDSTRTSGQRIVGDVEPDASEVASWITPVPGGVGLMTVAMLLYNTLQIASQKYEKEQRRSWDLKLLPLARKTPVPSDIEIAQSQTPKQINDLCSEIGLEPSEVTLFGNTKAKVNISALERLQDKKDGKYVVVCGMTPTPLGEGKTTTLFGLAQALGSRLHKNSFACIRQPSLGPTFGIKGGAAGGGYAQIIPMEDFNLHLTGDIHAISFATNLVASSVDTRVLHEAEQTDEQLWNRLVPLKGKKRTFAPIMIRRLQNLGIDKTDPNDLTPEERSKFVRLDIDPNRILWNRVVDVNDRSLRGITIGQGDAEQGHERKTKFDISVASEIMAVLALATDLQDMRRRFENMVVALDKKGKPVTALDLGVSGAVTVSMKDAIHPTLMQTLEGTPALVHAGPFANIAHGNSSIIADRIALKLVGEEGYVLTEAGFGADIGGEKFFDIKCRASGLNPSCSVLVCTIRAIKMHGGGAKVVPGKPLPAEYTEENLKLLEQGFCNIEKHIQNLKKFGIPVVVAINTFQTDSKKEIDFVCNMARQAGAFDAVETTHWENGGEGSEALAHAVVKACAQPSKFKFLYDTEQPLKNKIEILCKDFYGASAVEYSELAERALQTFSDQGFSNFPICMAKTQYSFSADPNLKGSPSGFTIPIRDVKVCSGAGFIYPLVGEMSTMPGLPTRPAYYDIDIDENGNIVGLF